MSKKCHRQKNATVKKMTRQKNDAFENRDFEKWTKFPTFPDPRCCMGGRFFFHFFLFYLFFLKKNENCHQ